MAHPFSSENRSFVSKRLRTRLLMFLGISLVILCFMVRDIVVGDVVWWMALIALAVGLVLGYIFGRLVRVRWHENEEKIITQMDTAGFIVIGVYILLSIGRNFLLRDFFAGAALTAITLAIVAGVLFGRFIGMNVAIMQVLRTRKD